MANQQDDGNGVDYVNETNQKSKETGKKAAQKTADVAAKAAKNSKKIADLISKLAASAPILIYVLIAVVIILYIFALYGFLSSMPGMFIGKLKETGKSFWRGVVGFITGDFDYVDSDDVIKLAQYLQDQGYDVQGYGFADVKYADDSESTAQKGATKQIDSVIGVKYRNNYLHSYISASEETYQLSRYSIWGDLQSTGAKLSNAINSLIAIYGDGAFEMLPERPNSYSTGLLNINEGNSKAEINREAEQLVLYTDSFLGFKFGNVFSYDLSGWTSLYGRPVELFIALQLATGMPDLTYEIATDTNFNTKVNINLQNVSINFDTQLEINTPGGQTYHKEDVEKAYYNSVISAVSTQYINETDTNKKAKLLTLLDGLNAHRGNSADISNFLTQLYKCNNNIANAAKNAFGLNSGANSSMTKLSGLGSSGLAGVTAIELQELMDLVNLGKDGVKKAKLPYIASVTKHWYYKDIKFTVGEGGVYRASRQAIKDIKYNGEGTALANYNITINDALLTDEDGTGIFYQVNEPYVEGPNQYIADLFRKEYYKYDGTIERAHAIAKAELLDRGKAAGYKYIFNGEGWQLNTNDETEYDGNLPEKEKPRFATPSDTLTAFNILKQVHTEDSDAIYRMLKELATSDAIEGRIERDKLNEDLKQVLLWPFYTGSDNKKWKVSKDTNEYGIVIDDVAGEQFIMPGDGTISSEDGKIVIQFDSLKSNPSKTDPGTVEILTKKFVENDFYRINKDIVKGKKMIIEGVNCTASGTVSRGQVIGTAEQKVNIVMQYEDKSYIGQTTGDNEETIDDDVEDYMNQNYTIYNEEMVRKTIKEEKGTATGGTDIPSTNGGSTVGIHTGEAVTDAQVGDDRDLVYAIVAAEINAGNVYTDALAVVTVLANRLGDPGFAGSDSLVGLIKAQGQWSTYSSGSYLNYYPKSKLAATNKKDVIKAVDDCLDSGKRSHGFNCFYTYMEPYISKVKNWIIRDNGQPSDWNKYCRNIGGNFFYRLQGGKCVQED